MKAYARRAEGKALRAIVEVVGAEGRLKISLRAWRAKARSAS